MRHRSAVYDTEPRAEPDPGCCRAPIPARRIYWPRKLESVGNPVPLAIRQGLFGASPYQSFS
jgi:hypothetical protein